MLAPMLVEHRLPPAPARAGAGRGGRRGPGRGRRAPGRRRGRPPLQPAGAATRPGRPGVGHRRGPPHDADGFDGAALEELRRLLGHERVVGVGETGWTTTTTTRPGTSSGPPSRPTWRLARELDKALVVLCREAMADALAVLHAEGAPSRVVFHCFAGDEQAAARVVEAGWTCRSRARSPSATLPGCGPLRRGPARPDGAGDRQPVPLPHPFRGRPPARPGRGHAQTVAEVTGSGRAGRRGDHGHGGPGLRLSLDGRG